MPWQIWNPSPAFSTTYTLLIISEYKWCHISVIYQLNLPWAPSFWGRGKPHVCWVLSIPLNCLSPSKGAGGQRKRSSEENNLCPSPRSCCSFSSIMPWGCHWGNWPGQPGHPHLLLPMRSLFLEAVSCHRMSGSTFMLKALLSYTRAASYSQNPHEAQTFPTRNEEAWGLKRLTNWRAL